MAKQRFWGALTDATPPWFSASRIKNLAVDFIINNNKNRKNQQVYIDQRQFTMGVDWALKAIEADGFLNWTKVSEKFPSEKDKVLIRFGEDNNYTGNPSFKDYSVVDWDEQDSFRHKVLIANKAEWSMLKPYEGIAYKEYDYGAFVNKGGAVTSGGGGLIQAIRDAGVHANMSVGIPPDRIGGKPEIITPLKDII